MIAPPRVRAVVGPIVEMLAAVPSIIFGFWGIFILVPFIVHLEPGLNSVLGFIPLFGKPQDVGLQHFRGGDRARHLMILPIVSSLSRDLFLTVPRELTDGAAALGATRWEVIRGVVLPTTVSGVTAAACSPSGRALGEAIAVSPLSAPRRRSTPRSSAPASTLAARIAHAVPATGPPTFRRPRCSTSG